MKAETNYSLKEARKAVDWYRKEYGIDHSIPLGFMSAGDALDEFVNKLYAEKPLLGVNKNWKKPL